MSWSVEEGSAHDERPSSLDGLEAAEGSERSVLVQFDLPPGAYATMALREVMKLEPPSTRQRHIPYITRLTVRRISRDRVAIIFHGNLHLLDSLCNVIHDSHGIFYWCLSSDMILFAVRLVAGDCLQVYEHFEQRNNGLDPRLDPITRQIEFLRVS
eukprot:2586759-Pleurochrysis_carterae.AAC.2